jgi:hypothetical protein
MAERPMKVQFAKAGSKRVAHDFYPTPPEATIALLPRIASWPQPIWEPMCGTGAMSEVLIGAGKTVISSDPFSQGYGTVGELFNDYTECVCPTMITNPPFAKAAAIIEHAHAIGVTHLALLLKAVFWNAKSRISLFEQHPPAWVLPLTWRLDWDGRGSPTMDCSWCLWEPGTVETRVSLLSKPQTAVTVPQSRDPVRLQEPLVTLAPGTTGDAELDSMLASPALSNSDLVDSMIANHRRHHANDPPPVHKVPGEGNSGRAGMSEAALGFYSGKGQPR